MERTSELRGPLRVEPVDESRWLVDARRGDASAFEQLFRSYHASVLMLCRRILGPEDAQDATQAAFVQAFRSLHRFRGQSSIKTWLYRIALNEALAVVRRRKDVVRLDEADLPPGDGTAELSERLTVHQALSAIKPDHRAVLVLRFWEDLTYDEIAQVLNVSLPAVKMRLSRAREEFRKCYEQLR